MDHLKDKLHTIDGVLANLDKQKEEIYSHENELNKERHLLIQNIFTEESPLDGTKWELTVSDYNDKIYLEYIDDQSKLEYVRDLCFSSWHDSFEIQDGLRLRFDDGDLSLIAEDVNQITNYAKEHNLTIVATDIATKVSELSNKLSALQEICRQFNL